jgi:PhnB protein
MTTAAITVHPHLTYGGDCEEAFRSYQRIFGGATRFVPYGGSPMADTMPEGWQGKLAHATLTAEAMTLAGADLAPDSYQRPRGFYVLLEVDDTIRTREIFDALAAGGEVSMPLQATFWSSAFGVLVDRFGIPWEINCTAR